MKNPRGKKASAFSVHEYSDVALPHLRGLIKKNENVLEKVTAQLVADIKRKKALFIFGSGHSALFSLELYHRAGGASFVIPIVADYLLPSAGPPVVRMLERTPGTANAIFNRFDPRAGEMVWIASQSGINAAVVDFALEAKRRRLRTVAFTSLVHSKSVASRHPSKKKLFEVCDETVDLGGGVGDALVEVRPGLSAGPVSTLGSILLAHSILVAAVGRLEKAGVHCTYASVNTPGGEARNLGLEKAAMRRDYMLR